MSTHARDIGDNSRAALCAPCHRFILPYRRFHEHDRKHDAPLAPGEEGFTITITPAEVEEERERAALDAHVRRTYRRAIQRGAIVSLSESAARKDAVTLAVWAVVGVALAVRFFRWE